jgi:hypothetical protein
MDQSAESALAARLLENCVYPGHFTSRAGHSRKASGHKAVLRILRVARNAADAARSARPKGENFFPILLFCQAIQKIRLCHSARKKKAEAVN